MLITIGVLMIFIGLIGMGMNDDEKTNGSSKLNAALDEFQSEDNFWPIFIIFVLGGLLLIGLKLLLLSWSY